MPASRVVLTVLIPFGVGYYISYLYRTVNVVIAKPMAADLALSAAELGLLTSVYFIVFASFQTPLGILLDRHGPRRTQIFLLMFAVAGSVLFAISENVLVLALARGLIGLGVSGCLMAALKANATWFPSERLPLVNGCTVAFGSFGALSATVPVEWLFDLHGWRMIFFILAGLSAILVIVTWLLVPERKPPTVSGPAITIGQQFRELGLVYQNSFFWRVSIVTFVHNAAFLSYQSLWMGPWLRDVAGMPTSSMATTMLWFNIGMFAGVLLIGAMADWLQRFGIKPVIVVGIGILASLLVQGMFALEFTSFATVLCFLFGFCGSSTLLVYTVLSQNFPARLTGRVNTAQNMLTFIGAFAAQWGIGVIINQWPALEGGAYHPDAHQMAFIVMIALQVAAFVYFLWPRRHPAVMPE